MDAEWDEGLASDEGGSEMCVVDFSFFFFGPNWDKVLRFAIRFTTHETDFFGLFNPIEIYGIEN